MPDVIDYRNQPLGSLHGEQHLQAPFNMRPINAVVRVRNLSAKIERRVIEEAVSIRRGGSRSITEKGAPFHGVANVNIDALRFKVAEGENMNWERMAVAPQDAVLRLDGKRYIIEYPRDTSKPKVVVGIDSQTKKQVYDFPPKLGEAGEWTVVETGLWDLYMGNWERMHGDQRTFTEELQALASRGLNKWVANDENPYGYLEFQREEIRIEDAIVDSERMRSGTLIEI